MSNYMEVTEILCEMCENRWTLLTVKNNFVWLHGSQNNALEISTKMCQNSGRKTKPSYFDTFGQYLRTQ